MWGAPERPPLLMLARGRYQWALAGRRPASRGCSRICPLEQEDPGVAVLTAVDEFLNGVAVFVAPPPPSARGSLLRLRQRSQ
jgi:hypothetical protein